MSEIKYSTFFWFGQKIPITHIFMIQFVLPMQLASTKPLSTLHHYKSIIITPNVSGLDMFVQVQINKHLGTAEAF